MSFPKSPFSLELGQRLENLRRGLGVVKTTGDSVYLQEARAKGAREQDQKHKALLKRRREAAARQLLRRPKPLMCELCGDPLDRLVHHHWDDEDLDKGMWLCDRCHHVVEYYDKIAAGMYDDIIGRYIVLKEEIDIFKNMQKSKKEQVLKLS